MFNKSLITESRRVSALKKEMTPLRIDLTTMSAIFSGSGGELYDTTLDHCTCVDFALQGSVQPCKHMIRFAMELSAIPNDGMQSDMDAAKVKYYMGRARNFIRESDFLEFIRFSKAFIKLHEGRKPEDNILCEVMDLCTIEECPAFKFFKNGNVNIEKKFAKECESIYTSICNRLGRDLVGKLSDDRFVSMICEGE